ncbi:MAG TPA: DUF2127 domain-containing protein [Polyangiaceae bacterium]|nr:DUF2127 domain-containing protein [Polyangiaceae bacterium]
MRRERGLALIIAYKLIKGGLWLVFAVILVIAMQMGIGDDLLGVSQQLRHHSGAWSLELADLLVRASTRRGLWTLFVALLADGTLTLVEAWALLRGHWWGPWLVVAATSSLLPFEVIALVRHTHVSRALLLAVNLLIVGYLVRKALREHRERVSHRGSLS